MTTASHPTVPESPATIAIQIQQLKDGIRDVVMFPHGTPIPGKARDIGMRDIVTGGNRFWFNPANIKAGEIATAAKKNELPKILGHDGYGVPDKSHLNGMPLAVVAKDAHGIPAQDIATDKPHLPQAVVGAARVTPPGGSVKIETPGKVIGDRLNGTNSTRNIVHDGHGQRGTASIGNRPSVPAGHGPPPPRELRPPGIGGSENGPPQLHAGSEGQNTRRVTGSVDAPLNYEGQSQADDLARRARGVHAVFAAPNKRSMATALKISPNAKATPWLGPHKLGIHEGKPLESERGAINDMILHRPDQIPGISPYSGQQGESFHSASKRLVEGANRQAATLHPGHSVLNITSGRALAYIDANGDPRKIAAPNREFSNPGQLFRRAPEGNLLPVEHIDAPGQYFAQHGATQFNTSKPRKAMADGGTVTPGMATQPALSALPKLPNPNLAIKGAMKDITRQAASGDIRGALRTGAQHIAGGILKPQHVDRAMDLAGPDALKAGFNSVPELHQAVSIFRNASPEHQNILRPLIHQRIIGMEHRPKAEQAAVMAKLAQHGMMPGRQI